MTIDFKKASLAFTVGSFDGFPNSPRPQIALSGRSNVGKSSLVNCLLGRRSLARVSSTPGKTVTANFYDVDGKLYLVDLPGYGYAKRSGESKRSWSELTDAYFTRYVPTVPFLAVMQLIDLKTGPSADDRMMFEWMGSMNVPYFVVATKADKPNKTERNASLASLRGLLGESVGLIPFSSATGEGREEVRSFIRALTEKGNSDRRI